MDRGRDGRRPLTRDQLPEADVGLDEGAATRPNSEFALFGDVYDRLKTAMTGGLKLGLTGPSSVGKTTFARMLMHAGCGTIHPEGAREWLREHQIDEYWNMPPLLVAEMQLHILERYEASSCSIFDRTPIDALFFAQRASGVLVLDDFESRAVEFLQGIDVLLFFPYRSEYLEDDGVRLTDPLYQLRCGGFILEKLAEHQFLDRTVVFQHHLSPERNIESVIVAYRSQAVGRGGLEH